MKKANNSEPEYTISDNTLTFKSGGKYNYSHTICELLRIEVTDENYSKKGLGYQMLKFMEEIAEIFDAEQITGQFIPNGNLFYASMEFYKRNGFKFTQQTSSLIKIEKDLNKTKTINGEELDLTFNSLNVPTKYIVLFISSYTHTPVQLIDGSIPIVIIFIPYIYYKIDKNCQ